MSIEGTFRDGLPFPSRFTLILYRKLILLLLLAPGAFAQTSLVSSTLTGSISDSSGGRIPGAVVTAREVTTHFTREAFTDAEGVFRLSELPVGTYEVAVSQRGFTPYRHVGVTLQLGSTVHLDIVLQSGGVSTQVTVTAQPPAI